MKAYATSAVDPEALREEVLVLFSHDEGECFEARSLIMVMTSSNAGICLTHRKVDEFKLSMTVLVRNEC